VRKHVSNLELSRKMEELGCKQESEFYWVCFNDDKSESIKVWDLRNNHIGFKLFYSAFLASEIAESLPLTVCVKKRIHTREYFLEIQKLSLGWTIYYMGLHGVTDKTLPNALAKMEIFLLEHGLMEVGR